MTKKTIYIHIGTPKTGTTSVQQYLESKETDLYEAGCLVPKSTRRVKPNHTLLTNYCIDIDWITEISIRNRIYTIEELKKFRLDFPKDLRTEIQQFHGDTVVFSNEQCYGRLSKVKELEKLKALFEGLDCQIKIVVYLREQSDMLCSLYSSEMKQGKTHLIHGISEFEQQAKYDYNQKLKIWEEVFGLENIILRIFDRQQLVEGDIISDFCHTIQIPRYKEQAINCNVKLNAKQCEYLRLANHYIPFLSAGRVNARRVGLIEMVADTEIDSPEVSSWISRDYQEVYTASNQALALRYYGEAVPLFRKKPLAELGKLQTAMLTQADIESLTVQIIEKNKEKNESLCKCLAAIFEMEYEDNKIPLDYVYALHPKPEKGWDQPPQISCIQMWKERIRRITKLFATPKEV